MAKARVERRLAAVLVADVVGYSRLMGEDEAGTLSALNAHLAELIQPTVADYGGRVVKLMGDGALVEFPSVVDAVECAVAIQRGMAERNANEHESQQIAFRIGVNLGDIIIDGDDIYGDGVNIAARLEGLADPGGVCVSRTVFDQVKGKLDISFDDLGPREVKNIAEPVQVYGWSIAPAASVGEAQSENKLTLPDKPSIAVLPFDNMSGETEQEYFSDGIAEDIITALSRIRWIFVTARNSSFSYKGQSPDVQQVAKDLGVRYVLEGSVRKAANRVRINAQLVDGQTGNHIWAERYDRELEDVFAVQDEITQVVVGTIEPEMARAEQQLSRIKPPENMGAWDCFQRGMWHAQLHRGEELPTAEQLFRRAIEMDPNLGPAFAALSEVLGRYMLATSDRSEQLVNEAVEIASRAVKLDPSDATARCALGRAYFLGRTHDRAKTELQRAIELNPSYAHAYFSLGGTLLCSGRAPSAIAPLETAMRLSPRDYLLGSMMARLAMAYVLIGKNEEAVDWGRKAISEEGSWLPNYNGYLSALGHLGLTEESRAVIESMRAINPGVSVSFFQKRSLITVESDINRMIEGWRKAGLPD